MTPSPRLSRQTIALLTELLATPATWRHGYDLMKAASLSAGTLYPILIRLGDLGWLDTQWEERTEGGRPPRHLYRLTAHGAHEARTMLARATERGWIPGSPVPKLT